MPCVRSWTARTLSARAKPACLWPEKRVFPGKRRLVRVDCVPGTQFVFSRLHHSLSSNQRFPGSLQKPRIVRGCARPRRLCIARSSAGAAFQTRNLWPGKSFSWETETAVAETGSEDAAQRFRPSAWCCRGHSAGMSQRRVTPIPRGSRPSRAALTRAGERKASEIVIVTFRGLQPSR